MYIDHYQEFFLPRGLSSTAVDGRIPVDFCAETSPYFSAETRGVSIRNRSNRVTLLGVTYALLWWHIVKRKLSRISEGTGELRAKTYRNRIGTPGYPGGTAIAFLSPKTAFVIYLALEMFYFLPERRTRIPNRGVCS